ncbi:MAG: hypothetical protein RLN75_06175 [Longimicrobiales bacterium]
MGGKVKAGIVCALLLFILVLPPLSSGLSAQENPTIFGPTVSVDRELEMNVGGWLETALGESTDLALWARGGVYTTGSALQFALGVVLPRVDTQRIQPYGLVGLTLFGVFPDESDSIVVVTAGATAGAGVRFLVRSSMTAIVGARYGSNSFGSGGAVDIAFAFLGR